LQPQREGVIRSIAWLDIGFNPQIFMNKRLLYFGDAPITSGFGKVTSNLLSRFRYEFDDIDVWGINYSGWPHDKPYRIYPGGTDDFFVRINKFIALIPEIKPTHVLINQDLFNLSAACNLEFPEKLLKLATLMEFKTTVYFPVDSYVPSSWLKILHCVDNSVAYHPAAAETIVDCGGPYCNAIGHGVDRSIFHPRNRLEARKHFGCPEDWLDKLIVTNVNINQRRKAIPDTLQLFAKLKQRGYDRLRLFLHMKPFNRDEVTNIEMIADQLGLKPFEDYLHTGRSWIGEVPPLKEESIACIFQMSDLVLTTSLGEGWGFAQSEALMCGTPIAAPDHFGSKHIMDVADRCGLSKFVTRLPISTHGVALWNDNSIVRYPIDMEESVETIETALEGIRPCGQPFDPTQALCDEFDWDTISNKFLALMVGERVAD